MIQEPVVSQGGGPCSPETGPLEAEESIEEAETGVEEARIQEEYYSESKQRMTTRAVLDAASDPESIRCQLHASRRIRASEAEVTANKLYWTVYGSV